MPYSISCYLSPPFLSCILPLPFDFQRSPYISHHQWFNSPPSHSSVPPDTFRPLFYLAYFYPFPLIFNAPFTFQPTLNFTPPQLFSPSCYHSSPFIYCIYPSPLICNALLTLTYSTYFLVPLFNYSPRFPSFISSHYFHFQLYPLTFLSTLHFIFHPTPAFHSFPLPLTSFLLSWISSLSSIYFELYPNLLPISPYISIYPSPLLSSFQPSSFSTSHITFQLKI